MKCEVMQLYHHVFNNMIYFYQVEKDVVDCLQKALARRGLDMNVAALVSNLICYLVFFMVTTLFILASKFILAKPPPKWPSGYPRALKRGLGFKPH